MKLTTNACGQLCFKCGMAIYGDAVIADAPDGGATTYHPDCYEAELRDLRAENVRLTTALADLQRDWDNYRDNVQSGLDGAAARAAHETWQAFGDND